MPAYDPAKVYTTPAPAQATYVDDGHSDVTDMLATGAVVFGGAMILNEIFDDGDHWNGYWRGPPPVNWQDRDFRPRPNIDVNGNVNIGNRVTDRTRDRLRDNSGRIGTIDRDRIDRRDGNHPHADAARKQAAHDRIAQRAGKGTGPAALPSAGQLKDKAKARGDGPRPARVSHAVDRKPKAAQAAHHAPKVSRPSGGSHKAVRKAPQRSSSFEMHGGHRAQAASHRGHASRQGGHHR